MSDATTPTTLPFNYRRQRPKWDGVCDIEDSPLKGFEFPSDWKRLTLQGKRARLVALHWADNYGEACSMLNRHRGAMNRFFKRIKAAKEARAQKRRAGR